ncbi:MAG: DUF547 domain-containing protein [Saprospiraceae bacterium]
MSRLFLSGLLFFVLNALIFLTCQCRAIKRESGAQPVSHQIWDELLRKHVRDDGMVDYAAFMADTPRLNDYLRLLESAHPDARAWSRNEQMAYWINAYNAYTIQLVLRNYPVSSIKDIKRGLAFVNSVWDIKFINIQGHTYDLNNIEHNILRPAFKDARIHAAVNCASFSCPRLLPEAYRAEALDAQLDKVMRGFINDPLRNRISAGKGEVSSIFKWFSSDFKRDAGSVRRYLNRYAHEPMGKNATIQYLDYDWRLNDAVAR